MTLSLPSLYESTSASIVGIDLAWGEKQQDGLCLIRATRESSSVVRTALTSRDDELLAWLAKYAPASECSLLTIDAPLIVTNKSGCRPVEKQISSEFGKYHAFCHSSNLAKTSCARPLRVTRMLRENGYAVDFDLKNAARIATEVYPHPAMILLFELELIIKYKKGLVEAKRQEFKRLQSLMRTCLDTHFPELDCSPQIQTLLDAPWKKEIEDQTDAFFCALLGHLCRVVGTLEEGFILLPPRFRNGVPLMVKGRTGQLVTAELVNKLRDED